MPSAWFRYVVAWVLTWGIRCGGVDRVISVSYLLAAMNLANRSWMCCNYFCYIAGSFVGWKSTLLLLYYYVFGLGVNARLLLLLLGN